MTRNDWQPLTDKEGKPITLTWDQIGAVQRAFSIWSSVVVEQTGAYPDMTNSANWMKSCLLGRILTEGKPPLPDPPPTAHAAPWYNLIEEGKAHLPDLFVFGPRHAVGDMPGVKDGERFFGICGAIWRVVDQDGEAYVVEFARYPQNGQWLLRHHNAADPLTVSGRRIGEDGAVYDTYYDEKDWVLERL